MDGQRSAPVPGFSAGLYHRFLRLLSAGLASPFSGVSGGLTTESYAKYETPPSKMGWKCLPQTFLKVPLVLRSL